MFLPLAKLFFQHPNELSAAEIGGNLCPLANYRDTFSSDFRPLSTVDHLKNFPGDVGSLCSKCTPTDKRFTPPHYYLQVLQMWLTMFSLVENH